MAAVSWLRPRLLGVLTALVAMCASQAHAQTGVEHNRAERRQEDVIAPSSALWPGHGASTGVPADTSPHRSRRIVADGVGLHVLDWGGAGLPLVFLPGIGHSAHVFDDLAPRFTDRHRVVALTRVGYGDSDQPESHGYDLAARVRQLTGVLDALGLRRVVLVGHSLAGQELSAFARAHPERVAGLVFLDAAYDHKRSIGMRNELAPYQARMPMPAAKDLASAETWRQWQARTLGFLIPPGEAMAITTRDSTGRVVAMRVPPRVTHATLAAVEPTRWDGVRAPALAIYGEGERVDEAMPWLEGDTAALAAAEAILERTYRATMREERARFAREVPGARVETIRGGHYFPLMQADETVRRIRAFLVETHLEGRQ